MRVNLRENNNVIKNVGSMVDFLMPGTTYMHECLELDKNFVCMFYDAMYGATGICGAIYGSYQ